MKRKIKINKTIILSLICFFLISILTIYSCLDYINFGNNILYKQIIFYLIGFLLIFIIYKIDIKKILNYSFFIYLVGIILLFIVLIFGIETNGSKAWIYLPIIGGIQPSEFMKIGLILFLANCITKGLENKHSDFKIIITSVTIFLIPTILTFLEPDTGAVLIYFIITLSMLFISGIKSRWFILLFIILLSLIGGIFYLYFFQDELFIKLLGSNFFYRLDRIFDWTTSSGMQLENSIISISSSSFLGHGFNNILLYFPELQTDFIFASYVSCFGLIGAFILFILFFIFDFEILNIGKRTNNISFKLITSSVFCALIYQQIQNTAMTIGILPITGITLPFISYGGSSLISYMILIGLILNISKHKKSM